MTRLSPDYTRELLHNLASYDLSLQQNTGLSLKQIGARAVQAPELVQRDLHDLVVAAVPVTAGQGLIEGFSSAVAGIAAYLGFSSYITSATDVAGLAEALEKETALVMMADDSRFIVLNRTTGKIVDNAAATGLGFATVLDCIAGGVAGRKVLLIGCGRVGRGAALALGRMGAEPALFDTAAPRSSELQRELKLKLGLAAKIEKNLEQGLAGHDLLVDACPAANLITPLHIRPGTFIVAPGVPHGLTPEAVEAVKGRFVHDALEIGVATMLFAAVSGYDF